MEHFIVLIISAKIVVFLIAEEFFLPEEVLPDFVQSLVVEVVSIAAHFSEKGIFSFTQSANIAGYRPENFTHHDSFFGMLPIIHERIFRHENISHTSREL